MKVKIGVMVYYYYYYYYYYYHLFLGVEGEYLVWAKIHVVVSLSPYNITTLHNGLIYIRRNGEDNSERGIKNSLCLTVEQNYNMLLATYPSALMSGQL